jgi:tricarballylate dehydrogenase
MPVRPDRPSDRYDVVVVGTGLAGIASALSAWEQGASVLVVEKAPAASAGGNTRFSGGGFRIPRGDFTPQDLFEDLMIVTKGRGNKELLRHMAEHAKEDTDWLQTHGLTFGDQSQFQHVGPRRVMAVWAQPVPFDIDGATQIGSGNGVVRQLHPGMIEKVDVVFDTKAEKLLVDDHRRVIGLRTFHRDHGFQDIRAGAVVIATGGFQADQEMRSRYWGPEAAHWCVRGTRFNTGDGIRMGTEIGAGLVGDWTDLHCAVIDARTLPIEGGETNVNTYPFCIIVNTAGERFVDEGEDFRDRTYAKFGRSILRQPGSVAFVVYDSKLVDQVTCYVKSWKPTSATTLEELAATVGIDPVGLRRTVDEYNKAIDRTVPFDPTGKDERAARGLRPPKSNWAVSIEEPPFYCYTVTGGVTFTMAGLKTDVGAQVISTEGDPIPGLYAAGEVQGDFFYYNYPGGSSLLRASVYGRAAGRNAATHARSLDPVAV